MAKTNKKSMLELFYKLQRKGIRVELCIRPEKIQHDCCSQ